MKVCLGGWCKKRKECANYYLNNTEKGDRQIVDWSIYNICNENENGIYFEYCCGDFGEYKLFRKEE